VRRSLQGEHFLLRAPVAHAQAKPHHPGRP
jgi:hypothetical protein